MRHIFALLLLSLALAVTARAAENPFDRVAEPSYAGRFAGPDVTLRLKPEGGNWFTISTLCQC